MSRGEIAEGDLYDLPSRFRLEPFASITFSSGARWLVKGLMAATGLATIYGAAKQYKSFIALDLALHVAEGRPWAGRKVRQGAVVFICAEGANGFADRVAANREKRGLPADLPFFLVRARPNLGSKESEESELADAIAPFAAVQPIAAIFVDTLVRTLGGANENDDGMRNFVDNLEGLAERFSCLAVAVHHTGKDSSRGMRGSSSLHGAVVTSWKVEKVRRCQARITLEDAKDDETGLVWCANLERYVFGYDEDGDEKSVLLVASMSKPESEVSEIGFVDDQSKSISKPPPQLRLFLACLEAALASAGRLHQPNPDGPQIRIVDQRTVRHEYFLRRGDQANEEAKRKTFDNQVKSALERQLVSIAGEGQEKVIWKI